MTETLILDRPTTHYRQCPNSPGWLRGTCVHGNQRWIQMSCKRRDCPVCGQLRKQRTAHRIEYGLRVLGNGAWFVGTWAHHVTKQDAVKTQQHFIQWLRRDQGIPVQYAATWELTKTGRLHLNLVLAPWRYIDQPKLAEKWQTFGGGKMVWIEKVYGGIGAEVTKLRTKLGNYMAKFEQQVTTGRGINYSRDWPKIPDDPTDRLGTIFWTWLSNDHDDAEQFDRERQAHIWSEIDPGEYSFCGEKENCCCFEFAPHYHDKRRPKDRRSVGGPAPPTTCGPPPITTRTPPSAQLRLDV